MKSSLSVSLCTVQLLIKIMQTQERTKNLNKKKKKKIVPVEEEEEACLIWFAGEEI